MEENENQESVQSESPQNSNQESSEGASKRDVSFPGRKRKSKSRVRLIVFLVIILIVVGGLIFLLTKPDFEEVDQSPLPTPVEEEIPTPTPQEEVVREGIKVNVLNGTGISKAASSLEEKLSDLGYEDISVGNASDQDYEEAYVLFSDDLSEAVRNDILELLEDIYQGVDVGTSEPDDFEVEIITGYPVGYTPTPTEKPTATPTKSAVTSTPTPTTTPTPTGTLTPSPTPTP